MIFELGEENFLDSIKSGKWIILFGTITCYHCAQVRDLLSRFLSNFDEFKIGCIFDPTDVDLVKTYSIDSYPTIVFFENGQSLFKLDMLKHKADSTIMSLILTSDNKIHDLFFKDIDVNNVENKLSNYIYDIKTDKYAQLNFYNNFLNKYNAPRHFKIENYFQLTPNRFEDYISIQEIELPTSNLSIIPEKCFLGCTNLISIELPENIISVGNFGFAYCSNLKYIKAHNGLILGDYAFYGCPYINKNSLSDYQNIIFGKKSVYD